jgi:TusA-related sulfurtransferase
LRSKEFSSFGDQQKGMLTCIPHRGILGQEVFAPKNQREEDGMGEMSAGIDRGILKMEAMPSIPADQELNLKGKICPYTFIESMLTLEDMKPDEVLRVIVDYPPAVCDVPRSLKNEGYEILEVSPINETDWAILVRNKEVE